MLDISGAEGGFVRNVVRRGSLEEGFALLNIETAKGLDQGYASYVAGERQVEGLATDAQQAFVRRDGTSVRSLYFGGGTVLAVEGGAIRRTMPGLAYVERSATGSWIDEHQRSRCECRSARHHEPGCRGGPGLADGAGPRPAARTMSVK